MNASSRQLRNREVPIWILSCLEEVIEPKIMTIDIPSIISEHME
jgi:hypothetical protein